MANILLIERVMGQRIDIGILQTDIHNLMSKTQCQVTTHTEVARLRSIS